MRNLYIEEEKMDKNDDYLSFQESRRGKHDCLYFMSHDINIFVKEIKPYFDYLKDRFIPAFKDACFIYTNTYYNEEPIPRDFYSFVLEELGIKNY
jgi:hypothetical protein